MIYPKKGGSSKSLILKSNQMNIRSLAILLATVLTSAIALAQTNQPAIVEDFKPSVLNQPGQEYPQQNFQHANLLFFNCSY